MTKRSDRKKSTVAVEVGFALARASEHKTACRWDEALAEVAKGRAALFGDDADRLDGLDAKALVTELEDRERIGAFVALLGEQGEIAQRRAKDATAAALFERALAIQRENLLAHPEATERIKLAIRALESKLR